MARTAKNASVESRTARSRLKARREPYWTSLGEGRQLGYRRIGPDRGTWIAKYRDPLTGKRHYRSIGSADDLLDPDGLTSISFRQAQAEAAAWFSRKARELAGSEQTSGPYTVADAIADYLAWYAVHRKASGLAAARSAAEAHILPELGPIAIDSLTAGRIRAWHERLAASAAQLRSGERRDPFQDEQRRRKSTANRVLTTLRSALNRAFAEGGVSSDLAWRRVKPFRGVESARTRYLSDDEIRRLVNACPPDFRKLVQAAVFTGCRYGELIQLQVADLNRDSGTLLIRLSKSGKRRHVVLTEEALAFFEDIAAGKRSTVLLLTREDGTAWGKSHQQRPLAEACKRASITPSANFHALRHTHASRLAMRGVPMAVIATQLGHSDTRMAERHYAHLAPTYVAQAIRAGFEDLGITQKGKVTALR